MSTTTSPRGFTLLIAVVISSVVVSVSLALLDVTLKQVLLASAAAESQDAFYKADSALECALYWDQRIDAFNYSSPIPSSSISCADLPITGYVVSVPAANIRRTVFSVPCGTGGSSGAISIDKTPSGKTTIFASGYNSCDSNDTRRIERGLKAEYGT